MLTYIFAHRANIQFNRGYKKHIRPVWLILYNGKVYEAKSFSAINCSIRSDVDFEKPLPLSKEDQILIADINCWIEVEGELTWQ